MECYLAFKMEVYYYFSNPSERLPFNTNYNCPFYLIRGPVLLADSENLPKQN